MAPTLIDRALKVRPKGSQVRDAAIDLGNVWRKKSAIARVEDTCCSSGVPVFDGMDPRYKRVLWTVIGINGAMFLTEMVAGQLAGSQTLQAEALDFLADTVTYTSALQSSARHCGEGPRACR